MLMRMFLLAYLAFFVATASAQESAYNEQEVSFLIESEQIVGALTVPEGHAKTPIVVLLHGFGGDRRGPPIRGTAFGLFNKTAQTFAEHGIATLAISTRGKGGSQGDFRDMTLERRVKEALGAVEWIATQQRFDLTNLALLGHSQGTIIAAATASRLENSIPVRSVVLMAPQINPSELYTRSMGAAKMQEGINAPPGKTISWRGATGRRREFRSGFFRGLAEFDPLADLSRFKGRVLVVTGKRDSISPSYKAQIISEHHPENLTFMEFDVGHRMGASKGSDAVKIVMDEVGIWLAR